MTQPLKKSDFGTAIDADVLAVRSLIARNMTPQVVRLPEKQKAPNGASDNAATRCLPSAPDPKLIGQTKAEQSAPNQQSKSGRPGLGSRMIARLKSYQPDRTNIFWTSIVLLGLLKPALVFGTMLGLLALCLVVRTCYGPEAFWLRVVSLHKTVARFAPDTARIVKLRAYAGAKRWDRFLSRGPAVLFDAFSSPDLRSLSAAEARHDAIVMDRLSRLDEDRVTG